MPFTPYVPNKGFTPYDPSAPITPAAPDVSAPKPLTNIQKINRTVGGSLNNPVSSFVSDLGKGAAKDIGGTVQGLGQLAIGGANLATGGVNKVLRTKIPKLNAGATFSDNPNAFTENNIPQKIGGAVGEAAQALATGPEEVLDATGKVIEKGVSAVKSILPEAKTAGEKALSLTEKELSAVDKSKLKYLTDKGFDMTKTEGGILKNKTYQMTEKVKSLAKEFGNILTGKTPEENIKNVQSELGRLQTQSKEAFDGVNKLINKDTLVNGIKKSIQNMSDSVYEGYTKEQQNAFSAKRVSDFLSYVKDGTLKGLDDALESFRSANQKSDATISKAADATYQAVKKYIVDSLPEDKAAIYKAANQSQAKLFDIAEILKGKIQASVGSLNRAGKALKYGATAVGAGLASEGIRKVITGGF